MSSEKRNSNWPVEPKCGDVSPLNAICLGGALRSKGATQICDGFPAGCVVKTTSLPSREMSYSNIEIRGKTGSLLPDSGRFATAQ